mgnify:CR=1 FL=1|tara:strand:- start:70 stop:273 length:204 start_codon:yes stop_codon:yes gene_type:complete
MTVKENEVRITMVEEDVKLLDERVNKLETEFTEVMTKLDMIIKMGRLVLGVVGASLGLDLGMNGGMI